MPLSNPILDATLNHIDLEAIKSEMGPPPWSRSIVLADHVCGVVIYQYSGQENDNHCHTYDEWWVVLEGEIDWIIEGREDRPVAAKSRRLCLCACPDSTIFPPRRQTFCAPGHRPARSGALARTSRQKGQCYHRLGKNPMHSTCHSLAAKNSSFLFKG